MEIHPIRTEADYTASLAAVAVLVDADPAPGTPEGDALDILTILIERYEAERFPLAAPSPIEAIKFRMEQAGLSVPDMQPYIGNPNRVYEVLAGKRALSLAMIRRLHEGLNIPADVLIGAA
ncbi:hypothetical protein BSFA1_16460 [Burkholderia sp. SFA1]|uniref:Antitoxin HigA n=1 Tax=Caballeronia cordobensis TaxID=1353886 RepID=A0A158JM19_CABCO|nr:MULTISPECIES: transcriptional regulator [Caballeronia]AET89357.1 putative transcriptional regulator [Burkholderia sp. YI23]BBP96517.1 hypothetical protein BSFA1_16460 [Burkholderia sp. SFA1]MCE4541592.1 transcriptional regulator [Caballeronia sp. PC1]MCE4569364.1 transcriptional regulator [Caballeronia sp. CLC5]SAL69942.1 Antitoxin HigA [Caballeronia cordobensis]